MRAAPLCRSVRPVALNEIKRRRVTTREESWETRWTQVIVARAYVLQHWSLARQLSRGVDLQQMERKRGHTKWSDIKRERAAMPARPLYHFTAERDGQRWFLKAEELPRVLCTALGRYDVSPA